MADEGGGWGGNGNGGNGGDRDRLDTDHDRDWMDAGGDGDRGLGGLLDLLGGGGMMIDAGTGTGIGTPGSPGADAYTDPYAGTDAYGPSLGALADSAAAPGAGAQPGAYTDPYAGMDLYGPALNAPAAAPYGSIEEARAAGAQLGAAQVAARRDREAAILEAMGLNPASFFPGWTPQPAPVSDLDQRARAANQRIFSALMTTPGSIVDKVRAMWDERNRIAREQPDLFGMVTDAQAGARGGEGSRGVNEFTLPGGARVNVFGPDSVAVGLPGPGGAGRPLSGLSALAATYGYGTGTGAAGSGGATPRGATMTEAWRSSGGGTAAATGDILGRLLDVYGSDISYLRGERPSTSDVLNDLLLAEDIGYLRQQPFQTPTIGRLRDVVGQDVDYLRGEPFRTNEEQAMVERAKSRIRAQFETERQRARDQAGAYNMPLAPMLQDIAEREAMALNEVDRDILAMSAAERRSRTAEARQALQQMEMMDRAAELEARARRGESREMVTQRSAREQARRAEARQAASFLEALERARATEAMGIESALDERERQSILDALYTMGYAPSPTAAASISGNLLNYASQLGAQARQAQAEGMRGLGDLAYLYVLTQGRRTS
jgi:hypothetical protein